MESESQERCKSGASACKKAQKTVFKISPIQRALSGIQEQKYQKKDDAESMEIDCEKRAVDSGQILFGTCQGCRSFLEMPGGAGKVTNEGVEP